jgi:uncharacterized phage-associated protein
MTKLIRPPDTARVVAFMRMLFLRTEQELIREITRKRQAGLVDYAETAALDRVQRILQSMVDESWDYVPKMVENIFYQSGKAAGYKNARVLTSSQTTVVQQLSNNLLGEIVEASETAYESVKTIYTIARLESDPYRKMALSQVLRQQASGGTWKKSSADLIREMQNTGVTAFVDKAGRRWSLQAYGNMAVRTTARQAQVAALLTADDYDLWQIVKIGSTCPVCAALEGRVYSKSGQNPEYPPLSLAFGKVDPSGPDDLMNTYLNIHPNCLHSLIKYTTIGKTEKQIQQDKDFSNPQKNPLNRDPRTKKQIKAYREKERNRQRLIRDKRQHQKNKESLLSQTVINKMRIKLPDNVMEIKGMTEDERIRIEKAITLIEKQYDLQIGEIFAEPLGFNEKNTYFIVGPYKTESGLKMGLVINTDIDYTTIENRIQERYGSGFFAAKNLEDCVVHEMAHILTFQGCKTYEEYKVLHEKISSSFILGVSGYSDKSRDGVETLAEAFVKYRNGEKIPFPMKRLIKKYIERWKK